MGKLLIGIGLGLILASGLYVANQWYQEDKKRAEIQANILAIHTEPQPITIDIGRQEGTISPLLFGGTHSPLTNHIEAWDKIADVGVTVMRRDFFMELSVPANITLQDYITNRNGVQNPENWNQTMINSAGRRYKLAKERGMKTMGIVDYAPKWLTHSGTSVGVPKDWAVFRDIVKKHYSMYRADLDYLEVWNEPTFEVFNNPRNSGLNMEQAYIQIAKNIIQVIRQVDKEANDGKSMKLGGLVADNPDRTTMLRAILEDDYIREELDFISYHTYDHPEPTDKKYRDILIEYGLEDMSLFVTEWNYDTKEKEPNPYKSEAPAIVYTADKLLTMMQHGIRGANYYMLEPIDYDTPGTGKKYMGFYRHENNTAELLPQARTWQLLSKSLSLGQGDSIMVHTENNTPMRSVGFITTNGQHGVALVNNTDSQILISLQFTNPAKTQVKNLKMYIASADNDARSPIIDLDIPAGENGYTHSVVVPEQSVAGVILSDDVEWFNKIRYNVIPN